MTAALIPGGALDLLTRAAGAWPEVMLATPLAASLLVEVTLKVSVILLIAFGVLALLRERSAAVRHSILSAAIVSALALPLFSLIVPAWPLLSPGTPDAVTRFSDQASRVVSVQVDFDVPVRDVAAVEGQLRDVAARARRIAAVEAAQAVITSGPASARVALLLAVVWLLGASMRLSRLFVGLGRLRWLASRARRAAEGDEALRVARAMAAECGVRRPLRVLHGDHPTQLCTWGFVRPTILLPAGASAWTAARLRVVLGHEIAHIARADWPLQLAAELLGALVWCTPLVWMASRRLRAESEQACDDVVLSRGVAAPEYASHLVALARACAAPRDTLSPALGMVRQSAFERRIRAMLDTGLNRRPLSAAARFVITVAFAALALPIAAASVIAQADSGLVAIVRTPLGKPLPNATVSLVSAATQQAVPATTDASGRAEWKGLAAGAYRVDIKQMGFRPFDEQVTLAPGKRVERDFKLTLGEVQETITVKGAGDGAAPKLTPSEPLKTPLTRPDVALAPPVKLQHAAPSYPKSAHDAGVTGTVKLQATIGKDGNVLNAKVVTPVHPDLDRAALDAVRLWKFAPTLLDGVAVETTMNVSVSFAK